jgi:hypothetical protein
MAAPAAATYVTEAEAIINVTIYTTSTTPGVQGSPVAWPSGIVWTTFEGGDPSAATTKLHPGNMIGAVEQPGPIERSGRDGHYPVHDGAVRAGQGGYVRQLYQQWDAGGI